MQKFLLHMKDNDMLITELYRDHSVGPYHGPQCLSHPKAGESPCLLYLTRVVKTKLLIHRKLHLRLMSHLVVLIIFVH